MISKDIRTNDFVYRKKDFSICFECPFYYWFRYSRELSTHAERELLPVGECHTHTPIRPFISFCCECGLRV